MTIKLPEAYVALSNLCEIFKSNKTTKIADEIVDEIEQGGEELFSDINAFNNSIQKSKLEFSNGNYNESILSLVESTVHARSLETLFSNYSEYSTRFIQELNIQKENNKARD